MQQSPSKHDEFEKAREKFKQGVQARNRTRYEKLQDANTATAIAAAVDLAYNDAKRTLAGIGKYPDKKDNALKCIIKKLEDYFREEKAPSAEEEFDKIHDELCRLWCKEFKSLEDGKLGTYGKAQKIVNMSFKYLYCREGDENYRNHFKYCHMPLDSFTLEWFKREQFGQNRPNKIITSWSNLENSEKDADTFIDDGKEYYSYHFYKKEIRETAKGMDISPLEMEFIVWPQIQMELAAEGFLFGLEEDLTNERKKEIKAKSLKDKYDEIVKILKERGCPGEDSTH